MLGASANARRVFRCASSPNEESLEHLARDLRAWSTWNNRCLPCFREVFPADEALPDRDDTAPTCDVADVPIIARVLRVRASSKPRKRRRRRRRRQSFSPDRVCDLLLDAKGVDSDMGLKRAYALRVSFGGAKPC